MTGCWIPLPDETAIVVRVLDEEGLPVDDASIIVDSSTTLITGSQGNPGQSFLSLSDAGLHSLQLETASLVDPQGGQASVPLASQISAELTPIWFADRPFAGGSNVMVVPVEKGNITVVTIFVGEMLRTPFDNQWLTDGSNPSPYRSDNGNDEYQDIPVPVFTWREDPALGNTVDFTFQLWVDGDVDTRYPLGITDANDYAAAMTTGITGVPPDWQIPNLGLQRADEVGTNRVKFWSSPVTGGNALDLYYAPSSLWTVTETDYEKFPVLRDVVIDGSDGGAVVFSIGAGTSNPVILKNDVQYKFALKARNANSDLDTTGPTEVRVAVPPGSANILTAPGSLAIIDTGAGGTLQVSFDCAVGDSIRIYAAPVNDFAAKPYSINFIRDEVNCSSSTTIYSLDWLVNYTAYTIGVESYDSSGNVGGQAATVFETPTNSAAADTQIPLWNNIGSVTAGTGAAPGEVKVVFDTATDASTFVRRVSWAPSSLTSEPEAMNFVDIASPAITSYVVSDLPNDIPHSFSVRALDQYGNATPSVSFGFALSGGGSHPAWDSDTTALFTQSLFSDGATIVPVGWSYQWNGFDLARTNPGGEYVWRVKQNDGLTENQSKLGVFYTYSGYFYASTEASGLQMGAPGSIDQRQLFAYIESSISTLSTDVMGTPLDSSQSGRYQQKSADLYFSSLAAGSGTLNQLVIRYNTDADGQAVVTPVNPQLSDFVAFLRIQAIKKQTVPFGWSPHPLLQTKEIYTAYQKSGDELVPYPGALLADVFFFTDLATPDYLDLFDSGL
jgi:hypothetical protein